MSQHLLDQLTPIEFEESCAGTLPRETRISRLYAAADRISADRAWDEFSRLHDEVEAWSMPIRRKLLDSQLCWTAEETRLGKDVHNACNQLAQVGYRITQVLMNRGSVWDERVRQAASRTLYLMGETVKWEVAVTPRHSHDYSKLHHIMRDAIVAKEHRRAIALPYAPHAAGSTIESLYFRVLLLARFSSGALNARQIEILDAWMWKWMPSLNSVVEAPEGSALRVDLDSADGLRRGPRGDRGPSLYLPQNGIEKAYRAVLAQFHAGYIIPAEGIASTFRVEEYVAVLDLIQEGLKASRQPVVVRAQRHASGEALKLRVGLGEIAQGAEARRRTARLNDESETGFGIEGPAPECGDIAARDLVAIERANGKLELGVVARSVAAHGGQSCVIGVKRLGARLEEIEITHANGTPEKLLFVVGADPGGREDGFLVTERTYAESGEFTAVVGANTYRFCFNRARQRGRGWLLAGFEILSSSKSAAKPKMELQLAA